MTRSPGSCEKGARMDAETLSAAMGGSLSLARYRALLPSFEQGMRAAGITTPLRAAMFCAQLGHESVGLKWLVEIWGPTSQQLTYEGRANLGNNRPGDGYRFRGRGAIMITGRSNFSNLSRWAHSKGMVPSPTFFVDYPDQLATDKYYMTGAVWYWTVARPHLNTLSDNRQLTEATKAINGGTYGLDDRRNRYNRCLNLGAKLLPSEDDFMGLSEKEARELLENSRYIRDQIGPKHPAWGDESSLGKNDKGQELTFRDAFAKFLRAWKERSDG